MTPSCQGDTKLIIETQILHLKTRLLKLTTKLKIILDTLNIKHLWNQIQIPLKIHNIVHWKSMILKIFTKQAKSLSFEKQREPSEVFAFEKTQVENERLKLQHQKRIEASNQIKRKQELERNPLLQQPNNFFTVLQNNYITLKNTQMIPWTPKKDHQSELVDLNFHYLFHSSFVL